VNREEGALMALVGGLCALPLLAQVATAAYGLRVFLLADGPFELTWAGLGLLAALLLLRGARGARLPLLLATLLWAGGAVLVWFDRSPLLPLFLAATLLCARGIATWWQ
jgi:hypothetical protein